MAAPQENIHIAVLGSGFMGTAILSGLLNSIPDNGSPKMEYTACVRSSGSLDRLKSSLGEKQDRVTCRVGEFTKSAEQANVILLGVPPDQLKELFQTEGLAAALQEKVVISLLAGITCDRVLNALRETAKVQDEKKFHILRAIPSLGCLINDSVSLIATTSHAGEHQQKVCTWIFEQIGGTTILPENLMDDATALGAAIHALAFNGIDAAVDASVAEGVPRPIAMAVAAQNMRSAAGLLAAKMNPETLKESMSVASGITINSSVELERGHVRAGIMDAVRSAIRYARSFA